MTLTGEQKDLVRPTWLQATPLREEVARLFYGRLFETDPSTRPLFAGADMSAQSKKLMQTINVAVSSLDCLETVLPAIEELGRRHSGYGVRDEHYESVGTTLLWALGKGLGEGFSPKVGEAWARTYRTLAGAMQRAAVEPPPGPGLASPSRVGENRSQRATHSKVTRHAQQPGSMT